MRFAALLDCIHDEPVFETGLLLAGGVDPKDVRRQLSRWTREGKVHQLRRGRYILAPPYRKVQPHPFLVANRLVRGSYVSCQSVLAASGLIPEHVPTVSSICTTRPQVLETPLGRFVYRRIKVPLFAGYHLEDLGGGQRAFVASPEKALLDLIYLDPGADSEAYLGQLRLQNLQQIDIERLMRMAVDSGSAKLRRAASRLRAMALTEEAEYEPL